MSEIDKQLDRVFIESSLVADALRYRWIKKQKNISLELRGKSSPAISITAHRGSLDLLVDTHIEREAA